MDPKELRGLYEAYAEVYAPQEEIDEALTGDRIKKAIKKPGGTNYTRMHSADPEKRPTKRGGRGERGTSKQHDFGAADRGAGNKAARRAGRDVYDTRYEEVDIFDIVLEFLQVEGYAETLEEAEWIMANELDAEDIEEILEAEGSYGATPKARAAMGKVAIARREKPASEYSQKGEKTKKVREIEKHTRRIDNGPDVGNRGKKSTKPRWTGFAGKSGRGKLDQDSRDYSRADSAEYGSGTHGSGTVTKNPKKLRKQKAMGEHD